MTITRQAIRRELYNQVPGLGFSSLADSLTSTVLTDTFALTDTTIGANYYRGMYINRPDRTNDDRVARIISNHPTNGTVTRAGGTWSDTADLNYEIVGLLHPDELNACITRAMTRIYYDVQVPLTIVPDGDMEASNTSSWTASSGNITVSKSTTAIRVFSGTRSLRGVNIATNQFIRSTAFRTTPNTPFYVSAVVHTNNGSSTASIRLLSFPDSVEFATSASVANADWTHIWMVGTIPDGCDSVFVRLYGAEADADVYWNHVVFYNRHEHRLIAPSWLDEQFKFNKLRESHYDYALRTTTADSALASAASQQFHDWQQPSMFSLDPLNNDTNPYMIQLRRDIPERELWIQGRRPYSDIEPLTASDSDTTHAPPRLAYAYSKQELARVLRTRYPSDKRWPALQDEADMEVSAETGSRPETPSQPLRREHNGRV